MFPRRHSRRPLLHWLMLVGVMLGLVLQPVLASMGELHELTHGLAEAHLHADDSHDVETELLAQDEVGDRTASALHVVHHMAHCCGQTAAAAMAPTLAVLSCPVSSSVPSLELTRRPASEPALAPFRPPIHA
jgi:hypothetical protein